MGFQSAQLRRPPWVKYRGWRWTSMVRPEFRGNQMTPPPSEERPNWPNGARCAVMLSFDVDGPAVWINRDPRVLKWAKTFSLGAYGPWRGLPRILDLLEERAIGATFFVPAWIA